MLFGWGNNPFRFLFAWTFDGVNDRTDVADAATLKFGTGNQWSISFWVKAPHQVRNFITKGGGAFPRWRVSYNSFGANYYFEILLEGPSSTLGRIRTATGVPSNTWQHIVFTLDGANATNWRAYRNGVNETVLEANTLASGNMDNLLPLIIGAWPFIGQYLNGTLDEIQIYNRVLTPAEVTHLYNAGNGNAPHPSMLANLIARYSFDSAGGTLPNPILADLSGNGNNGTGQNFSVSPLIPH